MFASPEDIQVSTSNRILKVLYLNKLKEHEERLLELQDEKIIYVSDLVSCSHKRVLRRHYPEVYFQFEPVPFLGTLAHIGLEKTLEEQGLKIEEEFQVPFDLEGTIYTIKGRVDARGENFIVEIKTSRSDQGIPRLHHVLQLQLYCMFLEVEEGILIYVTPSRVAEYNVKRTDIDLRTLVEETVMDLRHPRWEWECKYCPFLKLCGYAVKKPKNR